MMTNSLAIDFSKTDLRKLASRFTFLSDVHPTISSLTSPNITVSKPEEVPHEIRKLEAILRILESSKKYPTHEIERLHEKIFLLKQRFS